MIKWTQLCMSCLCVGLGVFSIGIAPDQPKSLQSELHPENPRKYFYIGEMMVAQPFDMSNRVLGSEILAVGIGLAYRQDKLELAASMCIALAWNEPDAKMSASLWDFALMLDPDRHSAWLVHRNTRRIEQQALLVEAAECLYAARFNDPKRASELLERIEIREAIQDGAREAGFDPTKVYRLVNQMISDSRGDDCRGRVFITERNDGKARRVVCQDHARPIGASPNEESLRMLVKLELVLLNALNLSEGISWAANAYLGLDEPSRDPSISQIADFYSIDFSRPYRLDDRWASSP